MFSDLRLMFLSVMDYVFSCSKGLCEAYGYYLIRVAGAFSRTATKRLCLMSILVSCGAS